MKLILIIYLFAISMSKVLQHEINIKLFMRFYTFFFSYKVFQIQLCRALLAHVYSH